MRDFVKADKANIYYVDANQVDTLGIYSIDILLERYLSGDIRSGEEIYADISNARDLKKLQTALNLYNISVVESSIGDFKMNQIADKLIDNVISELSDDDNPDFMFQTFSTKLLVQIMSGRIDPMKAAAGEMVSRGFDKRGEWIGFDAARELWSKYL